jgi:hypothetical protein
VVERFDEVEDPDLKQLAIQLRSIEPYEPDPQWVVLSRRRAMEAYQRWNESRHPASIGGLYCWLA